MPREPATPLAWDNRIARVLARPLCGTGVTPNHVTTVSMLVGLAAAALYAVGTFRAISWGAALFVASCILDHVDGELARLSGTASAAGQRYDRIADLIVRFALFAGMGLGLGGGALGGHGLALGLVAGVAFVLIFTLRSAMARRQGPSALAQPQAGGFELDDVLYIVAPVTWLGWLAPFVAAASVGAPLVSLWVLRNYLRSRRLVAAPAHPTPPADRPDDCVAPGANAD